MASKKLRIGYLGGDLRHHAMSLSLAGIIEQHDRTRFEIVAYDHSVEDGSALRSRMKMAFDCMTLLGDSGPEDDAATISADQIDILIDLKGYTKGSRSELLSLRPAPVQVAFLGYVGTQANGWIDYVIADQSVLPFTEQDFWSERIVHLPGCYFPGDRERPIAAPATEENRSVHGLPLNAFIFTCFNSPYKIKPEIFAVWMDLLRSVDQSVIWLYEENPYVARNLKRLALQHRVSPDRLIFAQPAPLQAHINRLSCADLFLDTWPYNAHTTAADALWSGLPIVTLRGRSFASRVCSSMLQTAGVPELVCGTIKDYANLAFKLSQDASLLQQFRQKIRTGRDASTLFDATSYARKFEAALMIMAERSRQALPPIPFSVIQ